MPAAKKSASTKAAPKKKTAPKKAAPKKPAAKKAAPKKAAPAKVVAAPAFTDKYIDVTTNTGEYTLRFSTEQAFERALSIIKGAPVDSGGRRLPLRHSVVADSQVCEFISVQSYSVRDA